MKHKDKEVIEKKPGLFKRIHLRNKKIYLYIKGKILKSIRLELMLAFVICILSALIVASITNNSLRKTDKYAHVDYREGIQSINDFASRVSNNIGSQQFTKDDTEKITKYLDDTSYNNENKKILICDLDGKVLFKSKNASETSIDIYNTVKNTTRFISYNFSGNDDNYDYVERNNIYTVLYPTELKDEKVYLVVSAAPEGNIVYYKSGGTPEGFLLGVVTFISLFYYITKKKMKYIEDISKGLMEISKGDLDFKVKLQGQDELCNLSQNINYMANELSIKIEDERRIERTKAELITNVSHDLRTPLTSIKGYLGLIMDNKYKTEEALNEYVNIAFQKSCKLEKLINDLFEYTKLEGNNVKINKANVCINELLDQLIFEMQPLCDEAGIDITKYYMVEKGIVNIDGDKTVRVFENLLTNALRYSKKPGGILVKVYEIDEKIAIDVENPCDDITEEQLQRIFERFYRVDSSRNQETGGSGLGLAIAKSIVNLQGGELLAKKREGNIVFTVTFDKQDSKE